MNDTVKELVPAVMACATNTIVEHAITKVVMAALDAALPGAFSKFTRFAIRFGTGVVYEATIGEKVADKMMNAVKTGIKVGEHAAETL